MKLIPFNCLNCHEKIFGNHAGAVVFCPKCSADNLVPEQGSEIADVSSPKPDPTLAILSHLLDVALDQRRYLKSLYQISVFALSLFAIGLLLIFLGKFLPL